MGVGVRNAGGVAVTPDIGVGGKGVAVSTAVAVGAGSAVAVALGVTVKAGVGSGVDSPLQAADSSSPIGTTRNKT